MPDLLCSQKLKQPKLQVKEKDAIRLSMNVFITFKKTNKLKTTAFFVLNKETTMNSISEDAFIGRFVFHFL
jgi:hypothetical protein